MDMQTICTAVAVCKSIPTTAAGRAETAAQAAQAAAETAQAHAWGVTDDGTGLVFAAPEEDET